MIAIAIVTGVLGVSQTWLSNLVGQQVMHDLRAAVYRHLQRLSLAFFTRTRTGEVQSRIANDIGGVQTVVTSTATSIVSNVTTVLATVVAMFLLDWRLALFSLALAAVLRLAHAARRRASASGSRPRASGRWPTSRRSSRSRCRSPGSCSARRWAAAASSPTASSASRRELADLEVRQRMAGRWVMASIQMTLRDHARARLLVRRAELRRQRLARHARRVHHAADAAVLPDRLAALGADRRPDVARALRPRVRVPRPAGRDRRAGARRRRCRRCRGDVAFDDVWFRYDADGAWTLADVAFEVPAGHADGDRRRDGLGQDDARLPRRAALRRRARRASRSTASTCAT